MLILSKELEAGLDALMLAHCERQKTDRIPVSAALLIGSRVEEDAFVLLAPLVPLPAVADFPAQTNVVGRKPLKAPGETLDGEWVLHQAKQVLRSLPGGLGIRGILLLGDKSQMRELQPTMLRALKSLHKATLRANWGFHLYPEAEARLYLATMEAPRGKPSCLAMELEMGGTSSGRLSFAPIRWTHLRASVRLPPATLRTAASLDAGGDFENIYQGAFKPIAARFAAARSLFDGEEKEEGAPVGGKPGKKGSAPPPAEVVDVTLLLGVGRAAQDFEVEPIELGSELRQGGSLELRALIPSRASWAVAAAAAKEDVLRSLSARLLLHSEEMRVVESEAEDLADAPDLIHEFPRRIMLSPEGAEALGLPVAVPLSDYVFRGDEVADIAENLAQLFQLELAAEHLRLSAERLPHPSELGPETPPQNAPASPKRKADKGDNSKLILALCSVLAALVAAFMYILLGSS